MIIAYLISKSAVQYMEHFIYHFTYSLLLVDVRDFQATSHSASFSTCIVGSLLFFDCKAKDN